MPVTRPVRRIARPLALLLTSLLLLAACAPAAPSPTAAPARSTEAVKAAAPTTAPAAKPGESKPAEAAAPAAAPTRPEPKGTVTIVVAEDPRSLQMWEGYTTYGAPFLRNVGEALVNRDPKTNKLVPELALKWEQVKPDTWRFTLRQGVKFHDGSPFNAESAAFGINHTWGKESNFQIRSFIGPEMNARAVDEYTVDVTTEVPDPILPSRLYFSPLPSMKQLKEQPDQFPIHPVGTGPYKFVEWAKGQHIKLEWNPDWWGHTAPDAMGAATIKEVIFPIRSEREVRAAMVKRSEADIGRWVTAEQCKDAPKCAGGPTIETIFVRLDQMHHAMKDKRVREAMALAVDKDAIINEIMGGGQPAGMLVGASALGFNPDLKPYPYDPERARKLVAEAKADGVPVDSKITMYARRGSYIRIEEAAEAIAEMIKEVGFPNIEVRVLETAAHQDLWGAPKPISPDRGMIGIQSHGNEIMDFSTTVNGYYTCNGRSSAYCNPEAEELQKKALPLTAEEREKAYQALAKYLYDDFGTIPIGYPIFNFALSQRIEWTPRMDGFIMVKEMKLKE